MNREELGIAKEWARENLHETDAAWYAYGIISRFEILLKIENEIEPLVSESDEVIKENLESIKWAILHER